MEGIRKSGGKNFAGEFGQGVLESNGAEVREVFGPLRLVNGFHKNGLSNRVSTLTVVDRLADAGKEREQGGLILRGMLNCDFQKGGREAILARGSTGLGVSKCSGDVITREGEGQAGVGTRELVVVQLLFQPGALFWLRGTTSAHELEEMVPYPLQDFMGFDSK